MKNLLNNIKSLLSLIKDARKKDVYHAIYRLVEVFHNEQEEYMVQVQVINTRATFYIKPEEILSNDDLVDYFSPRDIRTLTYLGYLGMNSPKYKILAQRLMENDKLIFAIKKRGDKDIILKTAGEIIKEQDIIANLSCVDAKAIGYALAQDSLHEEIKQIEELNKCLEK